MRIQIIAATNRQPSWIDAACKEYSKRIRAYAQLEVRDVALAKRGRGRAGGARERDDEAQRMLAAVRPGALTIALDEGGALVSTHDLVAHLDMWSRDAIRVSLLIGGPDGLGAAALAAAGEVWSLSRLTLPHGLAKVVVIEGLYRALSLRAGHPYHRA